MNAILYLTVRSSINWFKKLKEKPAVAIITGVFMFFLFITLFSSFALQPSGDKGNINVLYIIFFSLSLFFVASALYSGLSTGTSFFNMSEVNFMFTAPLSSNLVLIYGVVRQMGRALLLSLFMLFQIGNLRTNFGLSVSKSLFILLQYMVLVFMTQIVTMAIYSFTNGESKRRTVVKYMGILLIISYIAYLAYGIYTRGIGAIQDFVVYSFPVAGWLTAIIISFLNGSYAITLLFVGIILILVFFIVYAMIKWKPDYYEDCLINSENTYHAKQYAKGDRSAQANIRKRKTISNVKSFSFKRGYGASAFMYRHNIEIRRSNKFLIFGVSSLLYLSLGIATGIIARNFSNGVVFGVVASICYLNMFLVGITKLSQDLSRQFIYLVPDSPFKKLLYASASSVFRPLSDGVLLIVPPIVISGFPILDGLAIILAFASINCIYIAVNVVMHAVFGKFSKSVIVFISYYILCFALLVPAVILGSIIGLIFSSLALGLFVASIVNFSVTLLIFFLCRNMVNNIDFS